MTNKSAVSVVSFYINIKTAKLTKLSNESDD